MREGDDDEILALNAQGFEKPSLNKTVNNAEFPYEDCP